MGECERFRLELFGEEVPVALLGAGEDGAGVTGSA